LHPPAEPDCIFIPSGSARIVTVAAKNQPPEGGTLPPALRLIAFRGSAAGGKGRVMDAHSKRTIMSKSKKYLTVPMSVSFVLGGIAALSFGFIAKLLSPAASAVKSVTSKVTPSA
jgi:hypothetical protein